MIVVSDVEASSRFYCELFGLTSGHGGKEYEQLMMDGEMVMQLHHDGPDDDHVDLLDLDRVRGNGALVWFEVADFEATVGRATALGAKVLWEPHLNENAKQTELWLEDPDGYKVIVASASDYRPR